MNTRTTCAAALLIAPFFVLPWKFDPRGDTSEVSINRLLQSTSPFAASTLDSVVHSVDPNLKIDGVPVLFKLGIHACRPDIVRDLLRRGADPNALYYDSSALIEVLDIRQKKDPPFVGAVRKGSDCSAEELVDVLLKHGARVRGNFDDPLTLAVRRNSDHLIGALLKAGADPNRGALGVALEQGNEERLQQLMAAGAYMVSGDPLRKLLWERRLPFVKTLVQRGLQLTTEDVQGALQDVIEAHFSRDGRQEEGTASPEEMLAFLLSYHPPLDFHFFGGNTPLIEAIGSTSLMKRILAAGASPTFKDRQGRPPLFRLVLEPPNGYCGENVEQLKLLLQSGADPNERIPLAAARSRNDVLTNWGSFESTGRVSLLDAALFISNDDKQCISVIARAQKDLDHKWRLEGIKWTMPEIYQMLAGRSSVSAQ